MVKSRFSGKGGRGWFRPQPYNFKNWTAIAG